MSDPSHPLRARVLAAGAMGAVAWSLVFASGLAAWQDADRHAGHDHAGNAGLIEGLGDWHHAVATAEPRAQAYFDQGLRLAYGFNHDEAVESFREAARLDPGCAMCWWGMAYVLGPNINAPMEREAEALEAARRAQDALTPSSDARERAYVEALALRYGDPVGADRATRDSAYARAMAELARDYPDDLDAQVLHAEALLLLRPWNQWTRDGEPQPGTLQVIDVLEAVLEREPDHAGACHYYIHTVEAGPTPERALECAERLPDLMPAAGHVVHMPAHVYLRTGRYLEAAEQNERAVHADHGFFEGRPAADDAGIYPLFYAPHNVHFLWFARMTAGQEGAARDAADDLLGRVSPADAEAVPSLQAFRTARVLTLVRFQRWSEVLAEPLPPRERVYERALTHYARGVARAALGEVTQARAEADSLNHLREGVSDDVIIILNPAPAVFEVALHVLEGHIARARNDAPAALTAFERAVSAESALTYDEPPAWYQGTRQMLGAQLLDMGRPADAEIAFRQDLLDLPDNGWSLAGLVEALERQGRNREANVYRARLRDAWRAADAPAPAILD